jgi:hypothetical protein
MRSLPFRLVRLRNYPQNPAALRNVAIAGVFTPANRLEANGAHFARR